MSHSNHSINGDLSDGDLFSLIRKGDKHAFNIIYDRYNKQLYMLAYRYLLDKAMAEDAVQHVFVKLWEYHSGLDITSSLKNYLYTMTKNYVLNKIRNENNAILHNFNIYQNSESEIYEDKSIEENEIRSIFYEVINKLPPQKKLICLLKLEGELTNQGIAEKMNISINTVKTHYAQSLKILKQQLAKFLIFVIIIILS